MCHPDLCASRLEMKVLDTRGAHPVHDVAEHGAQGAAWFQAQDHVPDVAGMPNLVAYFDA